MPTRRARPVFVATGGILAIAGLILLPATIAVTFEPAKAGVSRSSELVSDFFTVVLFSLVPMALGLWLLHLGVPGLSRRMRAAIARRLTKEYGWFLFDGLVTSPFSRAIVLWVISVIGYLVMPDQLRWVPIFIAMTAYSFGEPVRAAINDRWWIDTVQSIVGWLILMFTAAGTAEADRMREDSMIFLAPFMLFPAMIGLGALIRIARWGASR